MNSIKNFVLTLAAPLALAALGATAAAQPCTPQWGTTMVSSVGGPSTTGAGRRSPQ
jgi:hypothetical protein